MEVERGKEEEVERERTETANKMIYVIPVDHKIIFDFCATQMNNE